MRVMVLSAISREDSSCYILAAQLCEMARAQGVEVDFTHPGDANLPVNDPAKITAPTIIMRGQYDGIASLDDLVEFFKRLPNADKEFAVMPDIAHGSFTQMNYMRAYHVLYSFLTRPEPIHRERGPASQ